MFDAQIAVALFAAFLLGVDAGSGMEIIVRGERLDFAEEGETGEYVLTNTSTWKEWWVVISG